jgi:hypothetical protein
VDDMQVYLEELARAGETMVEKSIRVSGRRIRYEWHPDPTGDGGQVDCLPGVISFHADSHEDAKDTIRSLFSNRADA